MSFFNLILVNFHLTNLPITLLRSNQLEYPNSSKTTSIVILFRNKFQKYSDKKTGNSLMNSLLNIIYISYYNLFLSRIFSISSITLFIASIVLVKASESVISTPAFFNNSIG